jgi:acyl-CoA reductase-like NAD-dependent aldehyde dehydrogenase
MTASRSALPLARTRELRGTRASNPRGQAQQIDLFGDGSDTARTDTPAWQELPAETRATLTSLMARLILEHAETRHAFSTKEISHDL